LRIWHWTLSNTTLALAHMTLNVFSQVLPTSAVLHHGTEPFCIFTYHSLAVIFLQICPQSLLFLYIHRSILTSFLSTSSSSFKKISSDTHYFFHYQIHNEHFRLHYVNLVLVLSN
jgi:hypothetical protein